jgi:hypothetical protein
VAFLFLIIAGNETTTKLLGMPPIGRGATRISGPGAGRPT